MLPSKSERIMGRLTLVKQHCVIFLAWLPYSRGSLHQDGTFDDSGVEGEQEQEQLQGGGVLALPGPLCDARCVSLCAGCCWLLDESKRQSLHARDAASLKHAASSPRSESRPVPM